MVLKNYYINSNKTSTNNDKNTNKMQTYNRQKINWLQNSKIKGA